MTTTLVEENKNLFVYRRSREVQSFPFSRFPDFPKLLVEVSAKKVTNYNVIYIIIYLYIYKYIITLLLVGKTNLGKSGNREIYTFLL